MPTTLYRRLTTSLGHAYGTPQMSGLLAKLPPRKKLSREGGWEASLTYRESGLYLLFRWQSRRCWQFQSVHIYPGGIERFHAFSGKLEGRVSLSSARPQVRAILGTPSRSGDAGVSFLGMPLYHWDRYDFPSYSLRVEYQAEQGPIRFAILMAAALVATFDAAQAGS